MYNGRIKDLLKAGMQKQVAKANEQEATKLNTLRAGSGGLFLDGQTVGTCTRLATLRSLGINVKEEELEREFMFAGGRANEDIWLASLRESWTGIIKAEEEIPTSWTTKNGMPVTGRPDIVLCNDKGDPELGLELKQVSSVWTGRTVLFEGQPKLDHLIQSAHYSWQLGIPFELWYTSRVDFDISMNPIIKNLLPKEGQAKSEFIQYGYYEQIDSNRAKSGKSKRKISETEYEIRRVSGDSRVFRDAVKVLPFAVGYVLDFSAEGYLTYTSSLTGETRESIVKKDQLIEYYEYLSKLVETRKLGPRPLTLKADGNPENYSKCDYCPLKKACDSSESMGFERWLLEVKQTTVPKNKS